MRYPRDPLPLMHDREIPAAEILEAGAWGPQQAHRGRDRDGQPTGARALKAAAQTGSHHPPVGPPAATSKERGLASWDTRAPDGCGKFISPTGEGSGKAAGPGRGRCERPGDLGESPGGHQRAASPISPPRESPGEFPTLEAALVRRRPDPDRRQVLSGLTAGSCQSCTGCSVRAAYARTAWLGLSQHRPGRGTELDAATPTTTNSPQSSTRTRTPSGRRLLWASGGRGILGRGYCRSTPTASAAGGRRWAAPG